MNTTTTHGFREKVSKSGHLESGGQKGVAKSHSDRNKINITLILIHSWSDRNLIKLKYPLWYFQFKAYKWIFEINHYDIAMRFLEI